MNGVDRGNALETSWEQGFSLWSAAIIPRERERWDARVGRQDRRVGSCPSGRSATISRRVTAGKAVMQAFKDAVPTMIGGAADLVESTRTEFVGGGLFSKDWAGAQRHRVTASGKTRWGRS